VIKNYNCTINCD